MGELTLDFFFRDHGEEVNPHIREQIVKDLFVSCIRETRFKFYLFNKNAMQETPTLLIDGSHLEITKFPEPEYVILQDAFVCIKERIYIFAEKLIDKGLSEVNLLIDIRNTDPDIMEYDALFICEKEDETTAYFLSDLIRAYSPRFLESQTEFEFNVSTQTIFDYTFSNINLSNHLNTDYMELVSSKDIFDVDFKVSFTPTYKFKLLHKKVATFLPLDFR